MDTYTEHVLTAIIERDGAWYIGYCPEIAGTNGQGKTLIECRESLCKSAKRIMAARRHAAMQRMSENAIFEAIDFSIIESTDLVRRL